MNINKMTIKDFKKIQHREWDEDIGKFDSLIIMPMEISTAQFLWYKIKKIISTLFDLEKPEIWKIDGLHESGYRCMDFIAVRGGEPICRLSGCSDVLHIDGIDGFGEYNVDEGTPKRVEPKDWNIDCLRASGLLNLWCRRKLTVGSALSSFEVFANKEKKR